MSLMIRRTPTRRTPTARHRQWDGRVCHCQPMRVSVPLPTMCASVPAHHCPHRVLTCKRADLQERRGAGGLGLVASDGRALRLVPRTRAMDGRGGTKRVSNQPGPRHTGGHAWPMVGAERVSNQPGPRRTGGHAWPMVGAKGLLVVNRYGQTRLVCAAGCTHGVSVLNSQDVCFAQFSILSSQDVCFILSG